MRKKIGVLAKLPPDLQYLIEPAMKYGVHQTEDERAEFLECATPDERTELASLAERIRLNEQRDEVAAFLDQYPMPDYSESANLSFLFAVMDNLGLNFIPADWNTVARHVKTLGKFGSFRLASERAGAALLLSEFGDMARPAVPHLQRALQDEDMRVRVWAHYALAVIEGNRAHHEKAVREIYASHDRKDDFGCHVDDVGGDAAAALEKFAELMKASAETKRS